MQRLIDAIMQMISERLQKLSLYASALLDHLPVEHNVDKDLSEHATKEYRRLFSTFEDLLDFDDLKPEVFQSFREIGNAVVFIRNLSEALEMAAQSEFINLSPLLGLVPDSKQTDKRLYNKHAPVVKALKKLTTAVDSASVKALPVAASTIFDIVFGANAVAPDSNGSSPDLFQEAMERLSGLFREHDLFLRWGPFPHHSAPALSAGKDNKSFFRLWSALVFLYCVEDDYESSTVEGEVAEPGGGDVSNEQEFGHGLIVAGALFLHLLKQKHAFLLTDHTHHLVKVQQNTRAKYSLLFAKQDTGGKLEASMRTEDADNVAHDDDGNLPNDVSFFLDNARVAYVLCYTIVLPFFSCM
jgi:cytoplasmic FMR1 interacting protein